MTSLDDLWYLSDEADRRAEQAYHLLTDQYDAFLEFETTKWVSRRRFRTVTERIRDNGAPYGAHTVAHRPGGDLLLVRHEAIEKWVLPGGEADGDETFLEAAKRELHEEAGVGADYRGLGMLGRVTFRSDGHQTWGVLPMFEGVVDRNKTPETRDPDDEITNARWFDELPDDTRDRDQLRRWRNERLR